MVMKVNERCITAYDNLSILLSQEVEEWLTLLVLLGFNDMRLTISQTAPQEVVLKCLFLASTQVDLSSNSDGLCRQNSRVHNR